MKILQANAGPLTNFEVLDFLRSRGAEKDTTRIFGSIKPSEFKVYDYLEKSAARDQSREIIAEFMEKCKKDYELAKAEILNIINIRPSSTAELVPIVDQYFERFGEDGLDGLENIVNEVLPPPPGQTKAEVSEEEEKVEAVVAKEEKNVAAENEDVEAENEDVEAEDEDLEDGEDDDEQMELS